MKSFTGLRSEWQKHIFSFGLSLLMCPSGVVAQEQSQKLPPTQSAIQQIKKAVVFIVGGQLVNGIPASTAGTGFLVFLPEPKLGSDRGLVWIVTCDHVLRAPQPDGNPGPYYPSVLVRYNTLKPDASGLREFDWIQIPVLDGKGNFLWYQDPTDPSADIAMTLIPIDMRVADVKWLPLAMFLDKEQLKKQAIDENDEILFTGLFDWDPGSRKNYPIVRHGKIALIPEERVPLARGADPPTAEIYLAEVTSFGGNSGSPVFVRLGGVRETLSGPTLTGYSYYLLGVMKGFFPEAAPVAVETKISQGISAQNSGIAMVVPAFKIQAILASPAVRARVDEIAQTEGQKPAPKPK
ncbi:MAG TPA: hypothetical protein VE263_16260 [Candidatus Angelobacter sp.]|nr:hypothetical protein [Candidatus Angelobacter sp.]